MSLQKFLVDNRTAPSVNGIYQAQQLVRTILRQRKIQTTAEMMNQKRHVIVNCDNGKKYWVVFKRTFGFMSYGKFFEGENGIGESIKRSALRQVLTRKTDKILFVYADGRIYGIEPIEFQRYVESHGTERVTFASEEVTDSIPVKLLKRWDGE